MFTVSLYITETRLTHGADDGCLQTHWTLPWGRRVAEGYQKAGCGSAIWTLLREPVAHFISWFRWMNLGYRHKNFAQYMVSRVTTGKLRPWAEAVIASGREKRRRLDRDEIFFIESAENMVRAARNASYNFSVNWNSLKDIEKYRIFTIMLAQRGTSYSFQSTRLLPLFNHANTVAIPGLPQYDPKKLCGKKTSWESPAFALRYLRQNFDIVGLTELRAAAIVRVAQKLGVDVPAGSPLYSHDCTHRDNPARDFSNEQIARGINDTRTASWQRLLSPTASATSHGRDGTWFKTNLPPLLPKLLRILLNHELQFYTLARNDHWCQLDDVRSTVAKVVKTCSHPWEYENFNCPSVLQT